MTVYEPLNTLKPVAPGLWVIDGPAVICRRMPISTRATVVQLNSGKLWVHSPTQLTDRLQAELAALGPVGHLIMPNWHHTCNIAAWQEAYPEAKLWGVPDDGGHGSGVAFGRPLGGRTPWQDEVAHLIVGGSRTYREAVFFHHASASLIVTDLIQNFDTAKLPTWMRPLIWLAGADNSDGKMPYRMRRSYRNSALLGDAVEQMIAWQPKALILSHGDWFEKGARHELERAFKRVLREREWDRALTEKKKAESGQ